MQFKILNHQDKARLGVISTPHGDIQTPAFVPVGTQGTVKGLVSDDLSSIGASCMLANTYHLYLRPGEEIIRKAGGLHGFMNYDGPIFTDSGGFQVFSLGIAMEHGVGKVVDLFADDSREELALNKKLEYIKSQSTAILDRKSFCKIDDEGATFMSHLDGTLHRWNAERSMEIQEALGADLIFSMDECTSPTHDYIYTKQSTDRSHDWERRSLLKFKELQKQRALHAKPLQALYGIVQGGPFEDLRTMSAQFVREHDFDGVGIGGALVSKQTMLEIFSWIYPHLPEDRPRHLLGIGGIDDIIESVEWGVDTFDCAHPSRIARRGHLLLSPSNGGSRANKWRVAAGKGEWAEDFRSIDPGCDCYACTHVSRAYMRHLFWAQELTYYRLATIHNLRFMLRFMEEIRDAIGNNQMKLMRKKWLDY